MIPSALVAGWPESAYEVTVTLKVVRDDLEEVVARTIADPHCVDIRVHSAARSSGWAAQVEPTSDRHDPQRSKS